MVPRQARRRASLLQDEFPNDTALRSSVSVERAADRDHPKDSTLPQVQLARPLHYIDANTTPAPFTVLGIAFTTGWQDKLVLGLSGRMPSVSTAVAKERGKLDAIRPVPVIHAHLAAMAEADGVKFARRNASDVAGRSVDILNA